MAELVAALYDPTLLTFIGVTSIPIMLFLRRDQLERIDRGFLMILGGVCIISAGTFFDYFFNAAENLRWTPVTDSVLFKWRAEIMPLVFFCPGAFIAGAGLARWLPAIQRLDNETGRREKAEEELRRLAEAFERLAIRAEEASHAKTTFLASMSHELRTPLNAIIGYSEMIKLELHGPLQNTSYAQYIDNISRSGEHLLSVVNDILNLSKIEAGKLNVDVEKFDPVHELAECLRTVRNHPANRNLTITLRKPDTEVSLYADRQSFKQMMINLLSNAMKFTERGGNVEVGVISQNRFTEIYVKDNGVGIPKDKLEDVLKPFVQIGDIHSRNSGGTGLGLCIVKKMMELHGGRLEILSEVEVGTTAKLIFPNEPVQQPAAA